jgi:Lar family restriction alleviation protein
MTQDLLPCPFCGSKEVEYHSHHAEHSVTCWKCNIEIYFDVDLYSEEAIALWNKRASDDLLAACKALIGEGEKTGDDPTEWYTAIDMAHEAIAKAEGCEVGRDADEVQS